MGNEEGESARERKAVSQDAGNPNQLRQVIEVQQRNWKAREMEMPPTSWKYLEHIGCRIVLESSHVKQEIAANISIQDRTEARYAQVSVTRAANNWHQVASIKKKNATPRLLTCFLATGYRKWGSLGAQKSRRNRRSSPQTALVLVQGCMLQSKIGKVSVRCLSIFKLQCSRAGVGSRHVIQLGCAPWHRCC